MVVSLSRVVLNRLFVFKYFYIVLQAKEHAFSYSCESLTEDDKIVVLENISTEV